MTRVDGARAQDRWVAENDTLALGVDPERCWFDVEYKRTGTTWGHDQWYETVGELTVQNVATGTTHVCHLSDAERKLVSPLNGGRLGFSLRFERIVDNTAARILVDGVALECQVELAFGTPELVARVISYEDPIEEWRLVEVAFPCRFGWFRALEDAYLAVPLNSGTLLPGQGRPPFARHDRRLGWTNVRQTLDCCGTGGSGFTMPMYGLSAPAKACWALLIRRTTAPSR